MNIVWKPVKNHSVGRFGYKPEAIVIHIAEGYLNGAFSWFNNSGSQASSHYMIGRKGEIWQFVRDVDTAWHAGGVNQPRWALLKPNINPNFYTIGIEHEGFTGEAWSNEMYNASAELIVKLCNDFKIPLDRNHIIGHNQINSVTRDRCPGNGVDFNKLINLALSKYDDPMIIEQLNKRISELDAKISNLNSQITNVKNENASLKTKNEQLQKMIKDYTDSSNNPDTLKRQNAKLRDEILRLQENEAKLNKKIKNLEVELNNDYSNDENDNQGKIPVWKIIKSFFTGEYS